MISIFRRLRKLQTRRKKYSRCSWFSQRFWRGMTHAAVVVFSNRFCICKNMACYGTFCWPKRSAVVKLDSKHQFYEKQTSVWASWQHRHEKFVLENLLWPARWILPLTSHCMFFLLPSILACTSTFVGPDALVGGWRRAERHEYCRARDARRCSAQPRVGLDGEVHAPGTRLSRIDWSCVVLASRQGALPSLAGHYCITSCQMYMRLELWIRNLWISARLCFET